MRSYPALLLLLAGLWGASYLFIKVGVDGGLDPAPLMALRTLIAALVLLAYLGATIGLGEAVSELRASWREAVVLGALNAAVPFWLVAWGETHIDSGVAAIAQATVPLFSLLIGLPLLPHERVGPLRVAGVGLGLVGVGLLTGASPERTWWTAAGTLAVVLASACYASAAIYGQLRIRARSGPVLATGSMLGGFAILAVPAALDVPERMPTAGALASLAALALLGTALAQIMLFAILGRFGARRLSLVTYLIPGFALLYGWLLLDERIGVVALGGLALILAGVAFGSGAAGSGRRGPVAGRTTV